MPSEIGQEDFMESENRELQILSPRMERRKECLSINEKSERRSPGSQTGSEKKVIQRSKSS